MFSKYRVLSNEVQIKKIALIIIFSLSVWATGLPGVLLKAQAVQLDTISDLISTSVPGATANHTISFETTTGVPEDGSTIVVTMPTGFNVSSIDEGDIDIEDDGSDLTVGASCGSVEAAASVSGQDITIEICSGGGGAIAGGSVVVIEVGTHADGGANQIVNHATPDDYVVQISGTMTDAGDTRIVIIESVNVSASIETRFEFSVNGVGAGLTINDDAIDTSEVSTGTTIPFGTLTPGTAKVVAQELRVDTNALNGFSVTVQADQTLTAGNNATIDEFVDGTAVSSTTVWSAPSGTMGDEYTYGHWGVTSDDDGISGGATDVWGVGEAAYRGDFIGNPVEVFYNDGPVMQSSGVGVGSTTVAYKVQISPLQEAATDYTANLMYIATPVF